MKILGIDWGETKMGLAISDGPLAEPLKVLRSEDVGIMIKKINKIVEEKGIEKVIVGVSEKESGRKAREFGKKLGDTVNLEIGYWDESLSTKEAQRMSREGGVKMKKRRQMEDAYAAAIVLQGWLDNQTSVL